MAKAVWVTWVDSVKIEGWNSRADVSGLRVIEIEQIGFVVCEDEKQLVLCQTMNANGHDPTTPYLSPIAIPKVAVVAQKDISIHDG